MSASVRPSRSRTRARCCGRSVSRRRPLASCPPAPGPSESRPRVDDGRPAGTAARGSPESSSSLAMCGSGWCVDSRRPAVLLTRPVPAREGILCLPPSRPPPFQGPRRRAAPLGSRSDRRLIHCCRNLVRYHYRVSVIKYYQWHILSL